MNKDIVKKFELAEKLLTEKKYDESIANFKEILKIESNLVPAIYNLGLCYEFSNQLDMAELNYNKCHSIKPGEIRFINNLAVIYLKQKKFQQALPLLKKSLEINENQQIIVYYTFMCLTDLNKREDAVKFGNEKLKTFSDDSELNKLHGKNLMSLNKHKEGLKFLKKATGFIELEGNNTNIVTN